MATADQLMDLQSGADRTWLLLTSGIILTMQVGFALLEIGSTRKKNVNVVWQRTFINAVVTVWTWWLVGFAIALGGPNDRFIGGKAFFAGDAWDTSSGDTTTQYAHWYCYVATAMVVNSVINMSLAERLTLKASAIHTFFMQAFIFPVVVSWTWGYGWLYTKRDYRDFACSGDVFVCAGFAALAGHVFVGPRLRRSGFDAEGGPNHPQITVGGAKEAQAFRDKIDLQQYETEGVTSVTYTIAGGILLIFQFVFFCSGASVGIGTTATWGPAEMSAVNTVLSAASAATFGLFLKHYFADDNAKRTLRNESRAIINSALGGAVAILAGADTYQPWEALVIGIIAAFFYLVACAVCKRLELDDPLESFQVYGVCGTAGLGVQAFFNHTNGIFHSNPTHGTVLGAQILGWVVIAGWSFIFSLIVYGGLKVTGALRVDKKTEIVGYDFIDYAKDFTLEDLDSPRKADPSSPEMIMGNSGGSPVASPNKNFY